MLSVGALCNRRTATILKAPCEIVLIAVLVRGRIVLGFYSGCANRNTLGIDTFLLGRVVDGHEPSHQFDHVATQRTIRNEFQHGRSGLGKSIAYILFQTSLTNLLCWRLAHNLYNSSPREPRTRLRV